MKKYLIPFLIFLTGCITVNSVESNYRQINYNDGVNKSEAIAIAQKHLLNTGFAKRYIVSRPILPKKTDRISEFEKNHWIMVFSNKDMINIFVYGIIIDKQSGNVSFSKEVITKANVFQTLIHMYKNK